MSARSIRRSHQRRARRVATAAGAAIGGSALLASGAQAANFPVTNLNDAGANSLRAAITSANGAAGPDTISFSGAGASGEIVLLTEIPIIDDLTINGPGSGALAVSGDSNNNNVRDFATSAVALGDTRIFNISDPSSPGSPLQNVTISGLTLKEGVADSFSGTIQPESGGAIYSQDTALDLRNVAMSNNVATDYGGAVMSTKYDDPGGIDPASLTVTNSQFTANRARAQGGAISSSGTKYAPGSDEVSTTITNSQITGNRAGGLDFGGAPSIGFPEGGGLAIKYFGDVNLSGLTISGNTALTNNAGAIGGEAGGASLRGGTLTDSIVTGNVSGETAGGLSLRGTHVHATTVSGNTAPDSGGGITAGPGKYSPARLDSSTVSGNSATGSGPYSGYGGGITAYSTGDSTGLIVRSSTIAANSATTGGGGINVFAYNDQDEPTVQLRSTIVADNTGGADLTDRDTSGMSPTDGSGAFSGGFSLVENPGAVTLLGDPNGTNLIGVDPQLAGLADNGGPTQTHALAPTSPAVDAAQAGPFTTDQRGQARTVDAVATNSPVSDGTDIGAFELSDASATGDDPETAFKKKPKKKVKLKEGKKTAKVKLKFTGTDNAPPPGPLTFECKVDEVAFDECKSPLKLQLDKGKHKVQVRAIDADGNVDSSPVEAKIKVKKAKPKK